MSDEHANAAFPAGLRPGRDLPETPHELPIDRAKIDALLERVRHGERVDLLDELLAAVDWRGAFAADDGAGLDLEQIARLIAYYREKFSDIGPVYLADLLSTEFMTEQRARGDVVFSDDLLRLFREQPEVWQEIRLFFRRKEFVTALLTQSHASRWASLNPDVRRGTSDASQKTSDFSGQMSEMGTADQG